MATRAKQYQVRHTDGTLRIVVGHSIRGAARIFVMEYAVEVGGRFAVRERLGGAAWEFFVRTKRGIRSLGVS